MAYVAHLDPDVQDGSEAAAAWADEEARVEALDEQAAWDCGPGRCDERTGCPGCTSSQLLSNGSNR